MGLSLEYGVKKVNKFPAMQTVKHNVPMGLSLEDGVKKPTKATKATASKCPGCWREKYLWCPETLYQFPLRLLHRPWREDREDARSSPEDRMTALPATGTRFIIPFFILGSKDEHWSELPRRSTVCLDWAARLEHFRNVRSSRAFGSYRDNKRHAKKISVCASRGVHIISEWKAATIDDSDSSISGEDNSTRSVSTSEITTFFSRRRGVPGCFSSPDIPVLAGKAINQARDEYCKQWRALTYRLGFPGVPDPLDAPIPHGKGYGAKRARIRDQNDDLQEVFSEEEE
ncbi:hypothetical protein BU16DRAFT_535506 [Lophium mytilinum]|uniref:Uncharacterized protein n=1 Tax=Lophium mytilinum TaxID=390894 RepID=A0A6A6R3N3_9PEZI|nr:hypothetical protein BU16DRAFT_535506 [Lophium mytilinum]